MKIGIYTGSFDPFHNGHIKIVKTILDKKIVDKVFIIPSADYWNKKINLSFEDRAELIDRSLRNKIDNDKYEVNGELGKYPFTFQVFRRLRKMYPNDEFLLIMGGDNVINFDKWKHYKELTKHGFIVVDRNTPNLEERIKELNPKEYHLLNIKGIGDISSTKIRENIDDYESIKKMINKREYNYVYKKLKEISR